MAVGFLSDLTSVSICHQEGNSMVELLPLSLDPKDPIAILSEVVADFSL